MPSFFGNYLVKNCYLLTTFGPSCNRILDSRNSRMEVPPSRSADNGPVVAEILAFVPVLRPPSTCVEALHELYCVKRVEQKVNKIVDSVFEFGNILTKFLNFCNFQKLRSREECKLCRSRKMLQNASLLAIVAVDTEENELSTV